VTTNTDKLEVERFMKLWSVANVEKDFFIIVHVERLTVTGAVPAEMELIESCRNAVLNSCY
jgi:hypothetical protein